MCIKKKYILITILSIFIFFTAFVMSTYAIDINNGNFSKYLNCYINDIYTKPTYIRPLTKTDYYNIGSECYSQYAQEQIKAEKPKYDNYGFKVNGEFYLSAYQLIENGIYEIEVYFYERTKEGYYKARGTALESFNVYVDLDFEVSQTKTNFYYEYYNNEDEFLEDVKNSFNQDVDLTLASQNSIKNYYKNFKNEEVAIGIVGVFKNVSYNFNIHLLPISEIKNNFKDLSEVTKNSSQGQAFLYDGNIINSSKFDYIEEALNARIINNIYNTLELSDGQRCDVELDSKTAIKNMSSDTTRIYTILANISSGNESTYISVPVLIYKEKYLEENLDTLCIDFESYDYYDNQKIANNYKTYLKFNVNEIDYYDYENTPGLINFSFNSSVKKISYSLVLNNLQAKRTEDANLVSEKEKIKILTKYNYIILPKKDSLAFENQIKIESNVACSKRCETINLDGEDWLSINVYSSDNEIIANKNVKIIYKNNELKGFKKFLYSYGEFLRKIFE